MDTTPEYVRKCEKATELQDSRLKYEIYRTGGGGQTFIFYTGLDGDPQDSVLLVRTPFTGTTLSVPSYSGWPFVHKKNKEIPQYRIEEVWLPRQDQLQAMVMHPPVAYSGNYWGDVLREVAAWSDMHSHGASMEQLWLGYVMHFMYSKIWDAQKGEWVDEPPSSVSGSGALSRRGRSGPDAGSRSARMPTA